MILRKRRPVLCDRPRCTRVAVVACSMLDDHAAVCHAHVATLERLWGQVFVGSLP